ncbi:uncharacterized protein B0P05DRAFT_163702 [Gilbertella persicaria]|uniref:uncharacterized protein n=1 Tax=Gilbertella persicaria TaxID=101096 RepID=UPI002220E98F|nr:uncharacterized protein B0P05DRAFT_163702 [Gilbertella persicaria]KAI8073517.1 hypothetical protein B0P05DRAFT_163702 [Gilbertella persicaria]
MADLNWCTFCDNAISHFSESLYCSEQCLRSDALRNHPLLGYTYPEFTDFPRPHKTIPSPSSPKLSCYSNCSSTTTSPALTATTSTSSHDSPPKFSLLSSMTSLPPIITPATAKPYQFNYFSIFEQKI